MTMTNIQQKQTNHRFDLEERTLIFAKSVIRLCKELPPSIVNSKLIDQLVRSSGSVGANYREANDSIGKKDFLFRLKISRKESKETIFWLELIIEANEGFRTRVELLIDECTQIRNILSVIISKVENRNV